MLQVSALVKKFGNVTAVNGVNFTVPNGSIVSLIGPNGSGKTTTVKVIAGLLQPTSGSLQIDGLSMQKKPLLAKEKLGYIPDDPTIWSGMTGEEYLHFTGALYSLSERTRTQRMNKLLETFGINNLRSRLFEEYSRGNKQKFSIIAALLHRPSVLLVDEPIVGLDPISIEIAKKLFQDFAAEGGSVLLVAHTLPVVEEISNSIGVLARGKLVGFGDMKKLREQAQLSTSASLYDVYVKLTS